MPTPFRYYDSSFIFEVLPEVFSGPCFYRGGGPRGIETGPSWEIMKQHYFVVVLAIPYTDVYGGYTSPTKLCMLF